jgi:hypothetical protein
LAGREEIIAAAEIALGRIRASRPEKSQMLLGLRGVGKTVLLNRISDMAEEAGYHVVMLEALQGQRLAEYLAPALKSTLLRLNRAEKAKEYVSRAVGALRGFASAFKVSIGEIEIGVGEPPIADSGNLEVDLPALLLTVGQAAKAAESSVAILVDEVQYLSDQDLRALIVTFHSIAQKGLPVVLFGAGLPQVAALSGDAKSYAERLFDFPSVGPLTSDAAKQAIRHPICEEGADIGSDALERIVSVTRGYPYFLQEWGKHSWNVAKQSPVTADDVEGAVLNDQGDAGGLCRLLQCGLEHDDGVGAHIEAAHQAFAFPVSDRQLDLEALSFASHAGAVFECSLDWFDVGIDVVDPDAGFVAGVLREFPPRGLVDVAEFLFHAGPPPFARCAAV